MEIINNSKTNYDFLFVDSSISEKNLIDFISTNKNCRIISFDFESADILKKCNIKFIAYTPSVDCYMKAADVFCLPSYREGFGSSIIEAACCGIPSIGSKIYGITDAIVDNKTGLLVNAKNINELASKMIFMTQNYSLRKEMGDAAKKNALKIYLMFGTDPPHKYLGFYNRKSYCYITGEPLFQKFQTLCKYN